MRFGQGGREILAVVLHRGEDVVRRAVHDAGQCVQAVGGKATAQRFDDGNAAGNRRLVANRQALGMGRANSASPRSAKSALLAGDHRASGAETGFHQRASVFHAADQLHHERPPVRQAKTPNPC